MISAGDRTPAIETIMIMPDIPPFDGPTKGAPKKILLIDTDEFLANLF